jgi:hypothetical protein
MICISLNEANRNGLAKVSCHCKLSGWMQSGFVAAQNIKYHRSSFLYITNSIESSTLTNRPGQISDS